MEKVNKLYKVPNHFKIVWVGVFHFSLLSWKKENNMELSCSLLELHSWVKVTKKQFTSCSKFKKPDVDKSGTFTWTAPAKPGVRTNQISAFYLSCIIFPLKVFYFVCSVGDHCKVFKVDFYEYLVHPKVSQIDCKIERRAQ